MPDTPAPAPAAPDADKPKRTRSPINQEFLDEIEDSRDVAAAASDPAHTAALAAVELDATLPASITALATEVENDLGDLIGSRAAKKAKTGEHDADREAILAALAPIQSAAKRKYKGDQEAMRQAYGAGTTLSSEGTEDIATFATGVLKRLSPGENNAPPADTLPGIKPGANGVIDTLSKALAKRGATSTARTTQQNKASATLEQITAKVETLATHRKEIQLAADQAWPWRKDGVEAIRKAFLLPVDRPLRD
ncbi:MAG: hypothetical protein ACKVY0_22605 [Prosthecobacter sp.]|uniref:hypothetical protein n=1 Tax=Prosthecobacter sp. TaxID=1965333 RepID=UPI0038FD95D0